MCTYSIELDDQLVAEAERTLKGLSLQIWLQQQVEALVRRPINVEAHTIKRIAKVKRRAENAPSDDQLEALFIEKPMPPMPEDASWKDIIDANTGKTIKPIEKWL